MKKSIVLLSLALAFSAHAAEYHVAKNGNDANTGSADRPLLTIQAAADRAMPGDTITVHEGVYRERVNPPRGGTSDERRIVYQAAPGGKVVITGAEPVKGWVRLANDTWTVTLPNTFFGTFNPYSDLVRGDWYEARQPYHSGAVYLNGHWLREAPRKSAVIGSDDSGDAAADLVTVEFLRIPGMTTVNGVAASRMSRDIAALDLPDGKRCLGPVKEGDWLVYEGVDFGAGSDVFVLSTGSPVGGGLVEIRADRVDGELLATLDTLLTAEWTYFQTFQCKLKRKLSGRQTLALVFKPRPLPPANAADNGYWYAEVDEVNTTIWAQFKGVDPNQEDVEINVRQSVFYPEEPGRNYITVRGFTLEKAATPWSPPTAEQIGLIGAHWCKGWIIEANTIRYSACTGLTLGKHGDEYDNTYNYYRSIRLGLKNGWSKENIGGHLVRGNHILHCGQAGIVGSLGGAFSTIIGNEIHDIRQNHAYGGCETAGIKLHGAIDVLVAGNHVYNCAHWGGIWLDWMSQGARVTGNLMHGNSNDLMFEMNHGPMLIDNNILLSNHNVLDASGGGAYVHNLIGGKMSIWNNLAHRATPYFAPHSTDVIQPLVEAGSEFGAAGGAVAFFTAPVENTEQDPVYQSVRYNTAGYRLDVPNGRYNVTLKFNEPFYTEAGMRIFGVKVQGRTVTDRLDLVAAAGKNRAYDLTAEAVTVENNVLEIGLVTEKGHPCIAGIEVVGAGQPAYALRINCGGPAWKEYGADYVMAPEKEVAPLLEQPLTDRFGVTVDQHDDRYINNLFLKAKALSIYDEHDYTIRAEGNVFLAGAEPSRQDRNAVVKMDADPGLQLIEKSDGWWLEMNADPALSQAGRSLVTSDNLGKAVIPDVPFRDRDGSPYRVDTDYFGKKRDPKRPSAGPFELPEGRVQLKVWPKGP